MGIEGSTLRWLVAAAAAAGTLDIVFAMAYWHLRSGATPLRVLQSVAAGWLGRESFGGGAGAGLLGLASHFAIMAVMAFIYYGLALTWPDLAAHWFVFGAAYGLILYAAMNFVVVPLSAAPPPPTDPLWLALRVLAHVALVGLPIAFGVHRALRAAVA